MRYPPRLQTTLVVVLVLAAAATLPIVPSLHGSVRAHPALSVLAALALVVGLPYVLVSATSPLVQNWYARCLPGRSPYPLFALSNLASMLALFGYPLAVEPWVGTHRQAYAWSAAYLVWAVLLVACAFLARRFDRTVPESAGPAAISTAAATLPAETAPSAARYGEWLLLSALGSWLLLALTRHLTADIAAIPLLWVLPLAVYLLTFIVAFADHRRLSARGLALFGIAALLLYAAFSAWSAWPLRDDDYALPIAVQIGVFCAVLAGTCLVCNGGLALTRPPSRYLTRFYLTLSWEAQRAPCSSALSPRQS